MSRVPAVLATVLLAAFAVHSADAQSKFAPLTNGDIIRLVTMRVSDQTVIAVINEAKTKQFDLTTFAVTELSVSGVSTAVIATMRQSLMASANVAVVPAPTSGAQTLAGASAEASKVAHDWELSTYTGPSTLPAPPAPTSTPESPKSEGTTAAVKDEGWWRKRMAGLREQLATDKGACDPIAAQIRALDSTYASFVYTASDGSSRINSAAAATIETKLVDAKTEQRKCVAKVALDQTAIATVEEEARRLGVLPGWLR